MKNGIFFFVTATNANKITSIVAVVSADGLSGDELDEFELEPCTSETNSSVNHVLHGLFNKWGPCETFGK